MVYLTSWVVSYGGKTILRWRTAAILKIVISPYLTEKLSDFDEILYTAAHFELDEHHVIKNENVALDRLQVRQNVFLVCLLNIMWTKNYNYLRQGRGYVIRSVCLSFCMFLCRFTTKVINRFH